ncbi:hypothetical protein SAMN05443572_11855 [Myxococcus fulvus]|uniref:Uncharacterized protein n=1 Tax=Myxococcus fulvus TaxID=33 RepID=A0A511TG79_MYXFU|nr:hypothetical protein [Myxococcus fulvus]AKF81276.1 hypothetical protein MFUL124B02_19165 [Myxococcus fulvus 124B02]GEN13174.1 hypothetical protein MFU01_82110 [Myxococcus fulvus]SEU42108.1 hypothetical protein SAMN05443572_11855 [Myxococcus fulvus]
MATTKQAETKHEETTPAVDASAEAAKSGFSNVEVFLKAQLAQAQKRIEELEGEAGKVVKALDARRQEATKEAQALWTKFQAGELLTDPRVKELGKKVDAAGAELKKRLDGLQTKVVGVVGVASQSQLQELNKELSKLSRKVDSLLKPIRRSGASKGTDSSPRA